MAQNNRHCFFALQPQSLSTSQNLLSTRYPAKGRPVRVQHDA